MSGSINVLKLVFSLSIFFLHCGTFLGYDQFVWFQGAFIYVEWFYIFMGYTLTKKVLSSPMNAPICETSARIIWDRMKGLLPYYFLSCTLALITKLYTGQLEITDAWLVHQIVFEYLMMQMTTLPTVILTNDAWFLSSMWISLVVLVPLLLKFRHRFSQHAILITIALYLYIYFQSGYIYSPSDWLPLTYKGNLRAISAICLGMASCELGEAIRPRLKHPLAENAFLLGAYLLLILYTIVWRESDLINTVDFLIPFLFMLLITLQMVRSTKSMIPDNKVTRFMGKISMVIYMNHAYIINAINVRHANQPILIRMGYSLVVSLLFSLAVYFAGTWILQRLARHAKSPNVHV